MYYKGNYLKPINFINKYKLNTKKTANDFEYLGFIYYPELSDKNKGIQVYTYTFPVYKHFTYLALEARILINVGMEDIRVDILDAATKGMFGPWYCSDNSINKNNAIEIINKNIMEKIVKLGIAEVINERK